MSELDDLKEKIKEHEETIKSNEKEIEYLKGLLKESDLSSARLINYTGSIQKSYLDIIEYNNNHIKKMSEIIKKSQNENPDITLKEIILEVKDFYQRYTKRHDSTVDKIKDLP